MMWRCMVTLLAIASCSEAFVKMIATPVVYTNGNGMGSDELEVPANGGAYRLFDAGNTVCAAWWVPFDNIGDLSAIHMIDVVPSGTQVKLHVNGVTNQRNGRVRIKIFAFVCGFQQP